MPRTEVPLHTGTFSMPIKTLSACLCFPAPNCQEQGLDDWAIPTGGKIQSETVSSP